MASVSGTGSLGNTSLRGYGGLVSGIDRDQVIEQLTAATNAKITNKKSEMTKLSWKQEAFQSISNKILALQDNFMSYSSSSNLKDASIFAKNRISILGDSKVTKFVSATGSSSLVNSLAILGGPGRPPLRSTRILSDKKSGTDSGPAYRITEENLNNPAACQTSNLKGSQLTFGYYNEVTKKYDANGCVQFSPSAYIRDEDGKSQKID
ncbi:MAG: flagellar cap protein FliD N-terminal domain-containing protein [Enterocloster clostridioformis]